MTRILRFARTIPFTILFLLVFYGLAIGTGALFHPAAELSLFENVATGLPAFAAGRWWTIFTAPFFLSPPLGYLTILPLVVVGFGWAERRFGTGKTLVIALGGHLVGYLGGAGIVAALAPTGWRWMERLSETLDAGPSCAAFTTLVFAIATLPSPWRLRARVAVLLWAGISLLYLGEIYDLEHAVAIIGAIIAVGYLPRFRHPAGRPTQREWRLIAFWWLIAIGVMQVFDVLVPYDGPLGQHTVGEATVVDVVIDVVIIALIANGVRRGFRVATVITMILGAFNLLTALLTIVTVPLLLELDVIDRPSELLAQLIAPAVFWLALMIYLIIGWGAFRVPLRKSRRRLNTGPLTPEQMAARVREYGGGTISWMTTWEDNHQIALGEGAAAFQDHSGVAIMLGDPIVPTGGHHDALERFVDCTQAAGLIPCVFSASAVTEQAKPVGWRSIVVAEDTLVDLPGLEFKGKPWAHVRTAINRAARENIEFKMVRLADEPWNVLAQVRAISEQWSGDKGLPEMRFTLGTVDEALDPETRLGIAVDADGSLHGVTSWLPVYSTTEPGRIAGWTLDLMRRRDGGFGPVMEFLIGSSAQHFSEAGHDFLSLSGAPLVRSEETGAEGIYQVLDQLAELIEPLYGFRSLHKFKQKFNPRHEALHMLYRDEGDLPRIGIALTRAYLPDATMRELVAAGASAGKKDN